MDDLAQPPVQQSVSPIQQTPQAPQSSPRSQKPLIMILILIALVIILGIVFYLIKGADTSQVVIQTDKSKDSTSPSATSIPTSIPKDKSTENVKNESIIGDKSLTIEKQSYIKGEEVRALFKFEGELFIDPEIKIFKFENDTWNNLGSWDINSSQQITCCGAIPSCSKYDSVKTSPLQIKWDQKVAEEELPILPNKNITKKQVESGKYKIRVVYGDQAVCMDGIEAEFIVE